MASLNKVLLIGNLTRDPELRFTPKGTAVADIGMAISRTYKTQDGQTHEEVCFVTVEVWGRQAETAGQYLSKGSPVFIEGELKFESWTNKEGKKQSSLKVRAERVQFLGRPKNAEYKDTNAAPKQSRNQDHEGSGSAASTSFEDAAPASDDDDIPF